MKISQLTPQPENPRTVTPEKLAQLKKALIEFGDLGGVVFNLKTKHLVGGHRRVENFDDAEIVYTKKYAKPTKTGTMAEGYIVYEGERYSYREVSWPLTREKAANIAANKNAGEWDMPQLTEWLKELSGFDLAFDMDLTMFGEGELADIVGTTVKEHTRVGPSGVDEDDVPEKAPARAKLGDVYRLGRHRLMCGSATKKDDVRKLFKGATADICFTSPPYNASKNARLTDTPLKGFEKKYQNHDDAMSDEAYLKLLSDSTQLALSNSRFVFVNLQLLTHNRRPLFQYQAQFQDQIKDVLIWNKRQCPPNIVKGAFNTKWEYVFCFSDDNRTRGFPCDWRGQYPNVVETESNAANEFADEHKAGFPVAFPAWFIEKFEFAHTIYDPFGGTGTTIIASEKYDRACLMMEIDPHYVDVIIERWEKYTGRTAKRVASAKSSDPVKPAKQADSRQAHA